MERILELINELTELVQKEGVAMVLFVDDKEKTTHYRCYGDTERFGQMLEYLVAQQENDGVDGLPN